MKSDFLTFPSTNNSFQVGFSLFYFFHPTFYSHTVCNQASLISSKQPQTYHNFHQSFIGNFETFCFFVPVWRQKSASFLSLISPQLLPSQFSSSEKIFDIPAGDCSNISIAESEFHPSHISTLWWIHFLSARSDSHSSSCSPTSSSSCWSWSWLWCWCWSVNVMDALPLSCGQQSTKTFPLC